MAMDVDWEEVRGMPPRSYVCGYCNERVSSSLGWSGTDNVDFEFRTWKYRVAIYVCSHCGYPTFFQLGDMENPTRQYPGPLGGPDVKHAPKEVQAAYNEARRCMQVEAYTAAAMMLRKLLMHVACEKGAPPGAKFVVYVNHLEAQGWIPPNAKSWVDAIRSMGNEAVHDLPQTSKEDAELLLKFASFLLMFMYEAAGMFAAGKP